MVNIRGQAVGLNAGGKNKAASAYYLPLHRIVRALRLLQASRCGGSAGEGARQPVAAWSQECGGGGVLGFCVKPLCCCWA